MPRDGGPRRVRLHAGAVPDLPPRLRRRGAAPLLLDLRRHATKACCSVGIKRVDGGAFSTWANEALKPGDIVEAMPPMGSFHVPLDPERTRELSRLRRRQRHHAGAVAHQDHARRASRKSQLYADLRQPLDQLDHVPRGARGPEEHLSRPLSTSSMCWRARRRTSTSSPAASTREKCAGAVQGLDRHRCGRHGLHLRPRADDAGDRRGAARARPARRPDQVRALRLRAAPAVQPCRRVSRERRQGRNLPRRQSRSMAPRG